MVCFFHSGGMPCHTKYLLLYSNYRLLEIIPPRSNSEKMLWYIDKNYEDKRTSKLPCFCFDYFRPAKLFLYAWVEMLWIHLPLTFSSNSVHQSPCSFCESSTLESKLSILMPSPRRWMSIRICINSSAPPYWLDFDNMIFKISERNVWS